MVAALNQNLCFPMHALFFNRSCKRPFVNFRSDFKNPVPSARGRSDRCRGAPCHRLQRLNTGCRDGCNSGLLLLMIEILHNFIYQNCRNYGSMSTHVVMQDLYHQPHLYPWRLPCRPSIKEGEPVRYQQKGARERGPSFEHAKVLLAGPGY